MRRLSLLRYDFKASVRSGDDAHATKAGVFRRLKNVRNWYEIAGAKARLRFF
jgi:hypothetical protein